MRIEKVGLPSTKNKDEKDPKVLITYSNNRGDTGTDAVDYSSSDEPLRSFRAAMQSLQDDVNALLGWPKDDAGDITVRSVSVKYLDGGRIGLVITGTKLLKDSRSPFNFNTPYLEQAKDKEDHTGCLPKKVAYKVEQIIAEAKRYLNGERDQAEMFEQVGAPPAVKDPVEKPSHGETVPAPPKPAKGEKPGKSAPEKKTTRARDSKLVSKNLKLHTDGKR